MKFAFVTRILGTDEQYIGNGLAPVPRPQALIERYEAAARRAKRRFGEDWRNFVHIEEVGWEEWSAYIGRKGGRQMTPAKQQALTKLNGRPPGRHMKMRKGNKCLLKH